MGRARASIVAVSLFLLAALLSGFQKPNFSGRWVVVSPADASGEEEVVQQDATSLSVSHDSEGGGHRTVYKLDGTESRNVIGSHESEIVTLSKASWQGDRLAITSVTTYPDGRILNQKEMWSLDAKARLVIDVTQVMQGRPPMTVTVIHTKK